MSSNENTEKQEPKTPQEAAMEDLQKDFGEEGLATLLAGADAIIDVTNKFGKPYEQVVQKIKEDDEAGLIRKVGDTYIAVKKAEEKNED